MAGDPFGKAKIAAFHGSPVARIYIESGLVGWESPFLYFSCLNEEDGLEFKVQQHTDGSTSQLRTFWEGKDVTEETHTFESLISTHPLEDLFKLRSTALLQDVISRQLNRISISEDAVSHTVLVNTDRKTNAARLRHSETIVLNAALATVELQVGDCL